MGYGASNHAPHPQYPPCTHPILSPEIPTNVVWEGFCLGEICMFSHLFMHLSSVENRA